MNFIKHQKLTDLAISCFFRSWNSQY